MGYRSAVPADWPDCTAAWRGTDLFSEMTLPFATGSKRWPRNSAGVAVCSCTRCSAVELWSSTTSALTGSKARKAFRSAPRGAADCHGATACLARMARTLIALPGWVEESILAHALEHLCHRCVRGARELALRGVQVASTSVRGAWQRLYLLDPCTSACCAWVRSLPNSVAFC